MEAQEHINRAIAGLKDFQKATVEYTIEQFYQYGRSKMLIADEVGLGKTIIAKGVVARMYQEFLKNKKSSDEFNVVYICSNQAIATQNINKLNFFEGSDGENVVDYSREDDRITALAYQPKKDQSKLNFKIKAFTPGTSFDQNTNAGRSDERVLLYRLLYNHPLLKDNLNSLKWLLKGTRRMKRENWTKAIEDALLFEIKGKQKHRYLGDYRKIRKGLKTIFIKSLRKKVPIDQLRDVYQELGIVTEKSCISLLSKICSNKIISTNYDKRYRVFWDIISYLRLQLSNVCKEYLNADLFILDEFQRYNKLIGSNESDNPGIELARQILDKNGAKVLMLSATPFKPYTNDFDELNGEHHYAEFKNLLSFLLKDESSDFWKNFETNRKKFFNHLRHSGDIKECYDEALVVKEALEDVYRSCISRTERMLVSKNKDAMIFSNEISLDIQKEDIKDFVLFDKIVQHLNKVHSCRLPVPMEYVKSCPYPLSFLTGYLHKKKLEEHYKSDSVLKKLVNSSRDAWVDLGLIRKYKPLNSNKSKEIPNAKIRLLFDKTIANDGWKYLWVPPSIPYYDLHGAFNGADGYSKTLIFSSWKMVPRMVASMVSYEAERLAIGERIKQENDRSPDYFEKKRFPYPLLTFRLKAEQNQLSGMNNFMLNYPSVYLSSLYDAKVNLFERKSIEEIKEELKKTIKDKLTDLNVLEVGTQSGDWQKWSWYAVLLLDQSHEDIDAIRSWLSKHISDESEFDDKEDKSGKEKHLQEVRNVILNGELPNVNKISEDQFDNLLTYLVDLCLGSPSNAGLRALKKTFEYDTEVLVAASYQIGSGFISLFNKPESIAIVQLCTKNKDYHRQVIEYCIDGNVQSMLDEYFYLLKDSNSVKGPNDLAETVSDILSIRSSLLDIGAISNLKNTDKEKSKIRSHFALDFGEQKLTAAKANRQINIREAFNSPFRPFVLASTSIGQEGLDFHFYCKKIVHWNLPSNPIDFEQREGRIHRYKGHVIRLNVAENYRSELKSTRENEHIWDELFELSKVHEMKCSDFPCDLLPYWHLENNKNHKIERVVPLYPFSRDIDKYLNMLKVLAYYRFTFGQPRQDELIRVLHENESGENIKLFEQLVINLSPLAYRGN
ncbi:MAG: hypothetical protein ACJA01_003940 [Saprospiraceae bacterium]|jgi:hypothetical protein